MKTIPIIFFWQIVFDEFAKVQVCKCRYEIPALKAYLSICVKALNKCAPKKSKNVRANNSPFMNKKISKEYCETEQPRTLFKRLKVNFFVISMYPFFTYF